MACVTGGAGGLPFWPACRRCVGYDRLIGRFASHPIFREYRKAILSSEHFEQWNEPIQRLFELINLDDDGAARQQCEAFWEQVESAEEEDPDEVSLIWIMRDVIDWQSGYCVDWKDTASFVECIETLCERHGREIDWGVDDPYDDAFLDTVSVPDLMALAYQRLQEDGITLWNWNTQGDAYAGWMTQSIDDAEMQSLAETLGLALRTADQPY